jgi:hypothetical protein
VEVNQGASTARFPIFHATVVTSRCFEATGFEPIVSIGAGALGCENGMLAAAPDAVKIQRRRRPRILPYLSPGFRRILIRNAVSKARLFAVGPFYSPSLPMAF